ncbi:MULTISPECIES: hypothetical protein [unclassified Meiothermus]|uniref:hypothetical protein n=1 Tax=unclassified Meiothermus TaxID=370471 RepID=UPI000D7BF9D5|nr:MULTISPECIES: hypothetical protein [unclassified Meiothermus]PZA05999.1 hypothetical protein DNA98_16080 [Meiothermus sp. Pnk-1]RYM35252.1 hypothetical protein EWH23_12260 [Meiothermus sp. PNK-Is4]
MLMVLAFALAHGDEAHPNHGGLHRLVVADAREALVRVLDEEGRELGRFTVPAPATLYPLPGGQYALAVHREGKAVSFLWGGLGLKDHGDHQDVHLENPYVAVTLRTGPKPTHVALGGEFLGVFHDGDGTVALFDLRRLGLDLTPRLLATGGADHASMAFLGNLLLVGGLEGGRVEAYTLGGTRVLALLQACPRLHGSATKGEVAAFGCADGVLLVERRGQGLLGRKVAYPQGTPEGARVGTLVAHPQRPLFVGNLGQGLALVGNSGVRVLPLPANPLRFGFDLEGEVLYVLTADGRFLKVDPEAGRVVGSLEAIKPLPQDAPRPGLALGHGVAYLSDPTLGQVAKVDLEAWRVAARWDVGGIPSSLALLAAEGAAH